MSRYCESCRKKSWPKTSVMGFFKCQICGQIAFCHIPDDRNPSKKQIEKRKEDYEKELNEVNNPKSKPINQVKNKKEDSKEKDDQLKTGANKKTKLRRARRVLPRRRQKTTIKG